MDARLYDGQNLKEAFKSAEELLEKRIDEINNLNVYPIPDGDTGINMFLTLQSANEAIKDQKSRSAEEIANKAATGALLGARGNSGVILSQILLGLAKGLSNKEKFSTIDFARALQTASESAYKAMSDPVEGTILTVIKDAAKIAVRKAGEGADLQQTITAVTTQARDTVSRTPDLLPVLKEAGVVDAGGKGLFYFFQGMKNYIGQKMQPYKGCKPAPRQKVKTLAESVYGYDLQFLIEGKKLPVKEIRDWICTMGESVLVVGDESLIRVHVHTKKSQAVMDYCAQKGSLNDIINDNMDVQVKAFYKHQELELSSTNSGFLSEDEESEETQLRDSTISP